MPTAPKELEALGELQRTLAEETMNAVLDAVQTPWKEFSLDVRSNPEGTTHSMKLRVTPMAGAVISVPVPKAVTVAILEIWQWRNAYLRDQDRWHGMKLSITIEGECEVGFNYDPKCKEDPAFLRN